MKPRSLSVSLPLVFLTLLSPLQSSTAEAGIPHLRRSGSATQLIVDGHPSIMLAGELLNSRSSSLAYLQPIWPILTALNLNIVIASLSWELVEPEEGKFDFSLTDGQDSGPLSRPKSGHHAPAQGCFGHHRCGHRVSQVVYPALPEQLLPLRSLLHAGLHRQI
jgi:hypothetical protein